MTLALILWLVRSVSAALWLVEHLTLARRSRRRGARALVAYTVPAVPCWKAGDRVGPLAWWAFAGAYALAAGLSFTVR